MRKINVSFVIVAVATALVLTSGCKSKGPKGGNGEDLVDIEDLGGWDGSGEVLPNWNPAAMTKIEGLSYAPVYFGFDDSQIPSSEYSKIDAVASFLRDRPGAVLVVEGNCDERGTTEYNMSLGEYRAQAIRSYLINSGIEGVRIQTVSYGEENPAVMGTGESVWSQNRRGEFSFYRP